LIDATDQAAVQDAMPKDFIVAATVNDIDVTDSVISIHFAGTEKSNLYAVVLRQGRDEITAAYGDGLEKLKGKSIRIVGKIVDYRGKPEIVISKPEQITIVG
jgi:DNA/RNA endonuclease YhcR with UshA esterase domain